MILKKVSSKEIDNTGDEAEFSVIIEPRRGHLDQDVIRSLEKTGASEIKILAPGHISAQINRAAFKLLESIAYIHPKQKHQLRRRVA